MSSIVGALTGSGSGGAAGMGFRPESANILNPATVSQANQQYTNVQNGLGNQQAFLNAVQAQNGLQNQSNVYNQMQGVANGTGPNPAQAQLAQATGANVANQNALMAGQRGASSNVGMIARQAAQQGAQTQQQAAGQAATLQANQSLNALNNMGSLATNQANQQANATNAYTGSALAGQQNVNNAIGAQNNANVGMQSNQNNVSGALAGNVATQQGGMFGNLMGGMGSVGQLFGGGGGGAMGAGGGDAVSGMGSLGDTGEYAGGLEDAGEVASMAAEGGKVTKHGMQHFDIGGQVQPNGATALQIAQPAPIQAPTGPQSMAGQQFAQQDPGMTDPTKAAMPIKGIGQQTPEQEAAASANKEASKKENGQLMGTAGSLVGGFFGGLYGGPIGGVAGGQAGKYAGQYIGENMMAQGGEVKAMVSPGETYLPPKDVKKVAKGANPLAVGEKIPGKPKVAGAINSYANDNVPKTLEEGGIVLPRSVTQSSNAPAKAAQFVAAILAKQHKGLKK